MRDYNVWVTVSSSVSLGDGVDQMELCTAGQLETLDNGYRLSYEERPDEHTAVHSVLTLENGRATLERQGDFSGVLTLVKGERHLYSYATPYGNLDLWVYTSALSHSVTPQGGDVQMAYTIAMPDGSVSLHHVSITIKPERTD